MKKWLPTIFLIFILVAFALHIYKGKQINKIHIFAFDSIATIPTYYIFDLKTIKAGNSFFGGNYGRILVGSMDELKPDFWKYFNTKNPIQTKNCGVNITETVESGIKTVIFNDKENYIIFAGTPESVKNDALESICKNKKAP